MAKRHFQLTEAQCQELLHAYQQNTDGVTRTRYQAVRLYGTGYPVSEILTITGCSRMSLMDWCGRYKAQGLPGLLDRRQGGNSAKLTATELADLQAGLQQYTPQMVLGPATHSRDGQFWTVTDVKQIVWQWYQVQYQSPTSYVNLLARCGFTYQRPEKVYKSQKPLQRAEFEEQLEKN